MSNFEIWLLLFGMGLAIFFITGSIVYLRNRKSAKRFKSLASALGGKTVVSFDDVYVRLFRHNIEVRVGIGKIGDALCLKISWMSPLDFELTLAKRNLTNELRYGFMKEVKIDIPTFDDKYFIRSNDPIKAKKFLRSPTKWNALEQLFRSGFRVLQTSKLGRSVVIKGGSFGKTALSPARIRSHIDHFGILFSS